MKRITTLLAVAVAVALPSRSATFTIQAQSVAVSTNVELLGTSTNLFSSNLVAFAAAGKIRVPTRAYLAYMPTGLPSGAVISVAGYSAAGDWGEPKDFRWDASATNTASAIAVVGSAGTGRFIHDWDGDMRAFGALGAEGVEYTTQLQAALDAGAGRDVYLKAGNYLTGTLTIESGTRLHGEGPNVTKMFLKSGANGDVIRNKQWYRGDQDILIEGIFFDGNRLGQSHVVGDGPGQSLVTLVNVKRSTLRNLRGKSPRLHGIDFNVPDLADNSKRGMRVLSLSGPWSSGSITGSVSGATASILGTSGTSPDTAVLDAIVGTFRCGETVSGTGGSSAIVAAVVFTNNATTPYGFPWVAGNSVTGQTSLATGVIREVWPDHLVFSSVSGVFSAAEVISSGSHSIGIVGAIPVPGCEEGVVSDCRFSDFGDDGITTHWSKRIVIDQCFNRDAAGSYSAGSNGYEIDDGSSEVTIANSDAEACANGVMVQGHAPYNVPASLAKLIGVSVRNCSQGFQFNYTGIVSNLAARVMAQNISASNCVQGIRVDGFSDVGVTGLDFDAGSITSGRAAVQIVTTSNMPMARLSFAKVRSKGAPIFNQTIYLITGLTFSDCSASDVPAGYNAGLYAKGIRGLKITDYVYTGNTNVRALYLDSIWDGSCSGANITGNTNATTGGWVELVALTNFVFNGNVVSDNGPLADYGVNLSGAHSYTAITGNIIQSGGVKPDYALGLSATTGPGLVEGNILRGNVGPVYSSTSIGGQWTIRDNSGFLTGLIFTGTANKGNSNAVSETLMLPSGVGTAVLPNYQGQAGRQWKLRTSGFYTTTGTPTLQIRGKLGSVVIVDTGALTMPSGVTNGFWTFDADLVSRTYAASGTVTGSGWFRYTDNAGTIYNVPARVPTTGADVTVNTTTPGTLSVTAQWGTANNANNFVAVNYNAYAE